MAQKKAPKTSTKQTTEEAPVEFKPAKNEELKKKADELMDKIDDILEDNAEEFVKNYVQKGGE
jgi:prokaryotic ubiquitin-like protein Pup